MSTTTRAKVMDDEPPIGARGGLRRQLIGLGGVIERNAYLVKRYGWWELAFFIWTVANTLSIVFIAKGVQATGGQLNVERATTTLLIGAVIWSYLGIIFEILTETVAWERWEGTIEYTFMAPLSRAVHLGGMGLFAVLYGVLRTALLFVVVGLFFGLHFNQADFFTAIVLLAVASVSFVGLGMVTAVLPLISPEKGAQLGFIAQGLLLVVSGVYYPVSVMPQWMQWLATISPATYALRGIRAAILDGDSLAAQWQDLWPLLVLGAVSIPLGLAVFRAGERYAKRHGKLKRSG
jgi:ABC-2 type transport system permease protein